MQSLRSIVARRAKAALFLLGVLAVVLGGERQASAENVVSWGIWRNAARTQIDVTLVTDQTPPIGVWTNTCVGTHGGPASVIFNNPGTPSGGLIFYETLWSVAVWETYVVTIYRNGVPMFQAVG
jgi:hypothetical protein